MRKIQITDLAVVVVFGLALSLATSMTAALAQLGPPPGGRPPAPSEDMLKACVGKAALAPCSFPAAKGDSFSGQCRAPPGLAPACLPAGGEGPPPGLPSAAEDDATIGDAVSTAGVLCNLSRSTKNPDLSLMSHVEWRCEGGKRVMTSNGVPDHPVGRFPNPGNPNTIAEHPSQFSVPLAPQLRMAGARPVQVTGYAINGVKFDPGTAESCTQDCANKGRGGGGPWRIEALNQTYFDFGVDANNAHVQPDGSYHYHGVPEGLVKLAGKGKAMALVGFAADGFPIYARFDLADIKAPKGAVRAMNSSWRLRSAPAKGRPTADVAPMGTFAQDYEYIEGSGDLDICNGRAGPTPEFPTGIYHYVLTDAYPFIPRCVRGAGVETQMGERGGPPPPPGESPPGRGGSDVGRQTFPLPAH